MNANTTSYTLSSAELLKTKVDARTAKIGIIGMGYVGLPLALLFSEQKLRVTGFDIDPVKVETLTRGGSYIVRIPETEIQAAIANGFQATSDFAGIADMDVVIICVPTPLNDHHEPDLSYIVATGKNIAPHLRAGQLIILESTTYPGTTEELLVPILEKNPLGLKAARNGAASDSEFYVVFSPEREDPGNDTVARRDIPKVIGGLNPVGTELGSKVYNSIFNRTVPGRTPLTRIRIHNTAASPFRSKNLRSSRSIFGNDLIRPSRTTLTTYSSTR